MAGLGALILTVGPSGAGKDALIAGAMQRLGGTGRFHVARRAVTRPEGAGGEDHIPMTPEAFAQAEADGGFLLSWRAHGLCYGIPREPASRMRETHSATSCGSAMRQAPNAPRCTRSLGQPMFRLISS